MAPVSRYIFGKFNQIDYYRNYANGMDLVGAQGLAPLPIANITNLLFFNPSLVLPYAQTFKNLQ